MMTPSEFDTWLRSLRANERASQVELLLALVEFDRHEIYLALGYDRLWTYCMKALHLCEGSTYRRTQAVKILRRFPQLAAHLRDGRLNLTTLVELGPLLDDDNVDAITARAAYMSKTEVERLIASLRQPVESPKELHLRRAPTKASPDAPIRFARTARCFGARTEAHVESGTRCGRSVVHQRPSIGPDQAKARACARAGEPRNSSRWQLEYDHIDPEGPSTVENIRLLCRAHNRLYAELVYGKDYMDQFRRETTFSGESPRDLNHQARSSRRRQDASSQPSATENLQSQLDFT